MKTRISILLLLATIALYGQNQITWVNLSNTTPNATDHSEIHIKQENDRLIVSTNLKDIKKTTLENETLLVSTNLKSFTKTVLDEQKYILIEDQLLKLKTSDLFPNDFCLDGKITTINFGDHDNQVKYTLSCINENTPINNTINSILEILNIKKEVFYK